MKDVMSSSELHLSSHSWGLSAAMNSSNSLVWSNKTYFLGKQRSFPTGHFQGLGRLGRAPPPLPPSPKLSGRSVRRRRLAGQPGASGWQLLRDSTCHRGLNGSQPKRRGCRRERLTPGIPTPGIFFLISHRLLSMVGVGFDWGGLCTSGSGFANSPWSHFVAFIDNGNVLIIGDSLTDCESSRKEHIAIQNVPLALTCAHPPIFLPFELLSICLSILLLLLCVCQRTRASRTAEGILQMKAITFGSPRALQCEGAGKWSGSSENLRETQELLGV